MTSGQNIYRIELQFIAVFKHEMHYQRTVHFLESLFTQDTFIVGKYLLLQIINKNI